MDRDGKDERRLETTNLTNLGLTFQEAKLTTMRALLALTHARGTHTHTLQSVDVDERIKLRL